MFSRQKQLSVHGRDQLENNEEKQELNTFYMDFLWARDFYRVLV